MAASLALYAAMAAILSCAATGIVCSAAMRRGLVAAVEARSSHQVPTPDVGGLGLLAAIVPLWGAQALLGGRLDALLMLALAMALAVVSFIDDRKGLTPVPRLAIQALAVAFGLSLFAETSLIFGGVLPFWADRLLAGLCWLWFLNLYNFMDGIDGITAVETVTIGVGLALAGMVWATGFDPALPAVIAGAALGFAVFNWHPARIFLGDVGSIPLGFLLGFLLLLAAAHGHYGLALILPAYHLADATLTLLRRSLAGISIWEPHREHFYQRAARAKGRHDAVSVQVAGLNLALAGLALLSLGMAPAHQAYLIAIAFVLAGGLLVRFGRIARAAGPASADLILPAGESARSPRAR